MLEEEEKKKNIILNKIKKFSLKVPVKEIFFKLLLLIILILLSNHLPYVWLQNDINGRIIEIIIIYFILNILLSLIRILVTNAYIIKNKLPSDHNDNFTLGIKRISNLIGIFILIPILFIKLGINTSDFVTSISVFSFAIVFIFKSYISNAIDSMIIMFSNHFKIKEYINVGDIKGRIIDINFQNTTLKTDEGDVVYIPNSDLLNTKVVNYSKSNIKNIRFDFSLPSDFYGHIEKLDEYLKRRICIRFENLIDDDNILLKTKEIKKDETLFTIEIKLQRYNFKIENNIKNYLAKQIVKFIDKNQMSNDDE
jgi:small-conductance mechanosensitive channel